MVQLRSANPATAGWLTDINAALDGIGGDGAAVMIGRAGWRGEEGEFSARLDSWTSFIRGRKTSGSAKLKSQLVSIALNGDLDSGWRGAFKGTVTASTPALNRLLRLANVAPGLSAGIEHASFSGTAESGDDGVALSQAHLMLNDTIFEGSLAWQSSNGRKGLIGTLATDVLDLDPILAALPRMREDNGSWVDAPLKIEQGALHDIDLRISANHAKLGALEADDAAFSALCRDGRMELSLGEARTYDGLVKGRALASVNGREIDVKLDASLSRVALDQLSTVLHLAPGQLAGSATGHIDAEGSGATFKAIVQSLRGQGQLSVKQGRLSGLSLFEALLQPDQTKTAEIEPDESRAFDLANSDFHIADGTLTIDQGTISGADMHFALNGQASLAEQSYVLTSQEITQTETPQPGLTASTPISLAGVWGGPVHRRNASAAERQRVPGLTTPASADDFP